MTRMITTVLMVVLMTGATALAADEAHKQKANAAIDKAIAFLRTTQAEDGSWTPQPGPAITGLIGTAMLRQDIPIDDPAVAKALTFIKSKQKDDGGFYDQFLMNYNTSIVLMMLSELDQNDPDVKAMIERAQRFLKSLQYTTQPTETGEGISPSHPHFGGAGYGRHGRPDLSNTALMLAALHDSGLEPNDPVYINAMTFVTRLQGTAENDKFGDRIEQDGGFIYATSIDRNHIGQPQSMASPDEKQRALEGLGPKSRLRTYGSMTYAGFMSYLYAAIPQNDPRVVAARTWIANHYTLDENPGIGMQGYFYYMHLFARALHANGEQEIETADGTKHNWSNELIDRLCELQKKDGSWANDTDRWMEGDPNLVTAFAVLALQYAAQ